MVLDQKQVGKKSQKLHNYMPDSFWKGKNGPMLIAEIGGNHEGDFEYAKRLTQLALASGADYVKFQIYTGDGLVNPIEGADRNKHFKKFELSKEQHIELARLCKDNNAGYLASVWIPEAIEWIDPFMDFYKIGSGDLTAYPIIAEILKTKKPILLSTGLATEQEVLDCVKFIDSLDNTYLPTGKLAILQCTSMYPIPFEDANLNVMKTLGQKTGCPIGYSDHTVGSEALETAVAMGAQILEFHFTDTREGKEFRDHKVSLTKDEVLQLIRKTEKIKRLQGESLKKPLPIEGDHVVTFRRGVFPSKDLPAGTEIKAEDLITLRPAHGIPADQFYSLVGKKTRIKLTKHQKLSTEMFE